MIQINTLCQIRVLTLNGAEHMLMPTKLSDMLHERFWNLRLDLVSLQRISSAPYLF